MISTTYCGFGTVLAQYRNMRIRVKDILDMLANGMSQEEILENYPYFGSK